MGTIIHNARILTEAAEIDHGWLLVEQGKITRISAGDPSGELADVSIDADGLVLAPGFIDIHVHGALGHETMDARPNRLYAMSQFYARHGVTSFLPTTWTASHERVLSALDAIASAMGLTSGGAEILGAHVEGPYLNAARCGAQDPTTIRLATVSEVRELLATGVVRLIALAPEFDANRAIIPVCREHGVNVSAAHTDATYDQLVAAVDAGLSQTTHTYNAMRGLHHREPGALGAALTLDQLYCEIIPDFNHVHPAVIQLLFRAKGRDKTIIITDGVRGTGMADGATYVQDDRRVTITDGAARLADGTLAGSTLTMDVAVRQFAAATGASMFDCMTCASGTPARAIGMFDRKGSIAVGKDADLILIDQDYSVYMTMVGGQIVFQAAD